MTKESVRRHTATPNPLPMATPFRVLQEKTYLMGRPLAATNRPHRRLTSTGRSDVRTAASKRRIGPLRQRQPEPASAVAASISAMAGIQPANQFN